jgi:hypothetical protein
MVERNLLYTCVIDSIRPAACFEAPSLRHFVACAILGWALAVGCHIIGRIISLYDLKEGLPSGALQ